MIEAADAENAVLWAELEAQRERYRGLELRVAELERLLGQDSTISGTPPSKNPIGARRQRRAERAKERHSSERERRKDRKRGGQPGHPGAGLGRDPDTDERAQVPPSMQCSRCRTGLDAMLHSLAVVVVAGPGRAHHAVRDRVSAAAADLPVLRQRQRCVGAA